MKVQKVKSCGDCEWIFTSFLHRGYGCQKLQEKIVDIKSFRDDCPLEDYYQHPKYTKSHDLDEYYKECGCEPFQSCNKCKQ